MQKVYYSFYYTSHGSIRVDMKFDKNDKQHIPELHNFILFTKLSIWRGFDKCGVDLFSFELPISLNSYLIDHFKSCETISNSLSLTFNQEGWL